VGHPPAVDEDAREQDELVQREGAAGGGVELRQALAQAEFADAEGEQGEADDERRRAEEAEEDGGHAEDDGAPPVEAGDATGSADASEGADGGGEVAGRLRGMIVRDRHLSQIGLRASCAWKNHMDDPRKKGR
jgi:hypothetical protein